MMRHEIAWLLAAATLPAAPLSAGPQIPRFSGGADLVVLSAVAVDKKGRPVTDLRENEFRVYEDGRPQRLEHFSHGSAVTARLLLLVDASGSMTVELKEASVRMTLIQILAALHPNDEVALAGFDQRYFGLVPFTRDRSRIEKAIQELAPWGTTALHDALDKAAQDVASHGEGRRAVVVITDGVDTASQKSVEQVIEHSRALDVPIYPISVVSPIDDPRSDHFAGDENKGAATKGVEVLARYAEMSGGSAFVVSDFRSLKLAAEKIVGELRHQYRLGYGPPPGPRRFRRVEVKTSRKGVVVKTRSGYLPQSQNAVSSLAQPIRKD